MGYLDSAQSPVLRCDSHVRSSDLPLVASNGGCGIEDSMWVILLLYTYQSRVLLAVEIFLPIWLVNCSFIEVRTATYARGCKIPPRLKDVFVQNTIGFPNDLSRCISSEDRR